MRTLVDLVCPNRKAGAVLARDLALIAGGALSVSVCAKIQVPALPVPMTLQTFAVLFVGASLGARRGGLALVLYLIEGVGGLPVFAGPVAGPAYFAGHTAGYLIAFPAAAFVVGLLAERGWDRRFVTALAGFTLGHALILAVGFGWLAVFVGPVAAFWTGVAPFLAFGVLKSAAAAIALPAGRRVVRYVDGNDGR